MSLTVQSRRQSLTPELTRLNREIEQHAREYGLDFYETFFEIEDFEERFVEVQAVLARMLFDFTIEPRQFRCKALPPALNGQRHALLALSQKIFNRLVDVFPVLDTRGDEVIGIRNVIFELSNELSASVRALDLAVTEKVHSGEEIRF